ncbi:helix-turn-helix domain-containing protein [Lactobacillus kalixensis]|uniref:HTH cro/C1-type domain-containing protein n=1 Tax=Lactobacillus kalixensis DSM 16043 TaxID=1423763 RepID=A0A0R1U823_9LACO|nr:Rgg/GadR/MutR family transcriptional regulator [Lactobacillus kalixensis]KRL89439.1 hypothetical protein FC46_GL000797 [Lactobacillus kalixensis DSM 16043]
MEAIFLTIGEALRLERKSRKISQKNWIEGTKLSISHYSQIENDVHKINADDLLFILRKYQIPISDFVEKIDFNTKDEAKFISYELACAFYANDLIYAQRLQQIINKKNLPLEVKYHAELVIAALTGKTKDMSLQHKNSIIKVVFSSDDWTLNQDSLRLFGRCMELFTSEQLVLLMKSVLKRYKDIEKWSNDIQERIATICINYLYNVWDKTSFDNINLVFELIDNLPAIPHFCIQKIISTYFKAVIDKDIAKTETIKDTLKLSGYKNIAKKLP